MAGRGRGRGRGKGLSFNVESLGFGRGESLPGSILEPSPKFPPLELKPVPLLSGEQYDYLLALKQEYNTNLQESQFFIKPLEKRRDIERYSDKYQLNQQDSKIGKIIWSVLPAELKPRVKRLKARKAKPGASKPKVAVKPKEAAEVVKHLDELEKQEGNVKEVEEDEEEEGGKKKAEGDEEEEEVLAEEDFDEEELEDETDYAMTYFDNGENYGMDEDDDLDEGAIY